jgi:hypothetical protein
VPGTFPQFKVVLGVELPEASVQRIARGIQEAVLNELASADLGGYQVALSDPARRKDDEPEGPWDPTIPSGIWITEDDVV